jgi:hypothetical protein
MRDVRGSPAAFKAWTVEPYEALKFTKKDHIYKESPGRVRDTKEAPQVIAEPTEAVAAETEVEQKGDNTIFDLKDEALPKKTLLVNPLSGASAELLNQDLIMLEKYIGKVNERIASWTFMMVEGLEPQMLENKNKPFTTDKKVY